MNKWNDPNVPKRGWQCVDMEDLESPREICQMCDDRTIRYVHVMSHDHFPQRLRCGCYCAEKMAGDRQAKGRENDLKRLAAKRARFLRKKFKASAKGHLHTKLASKSVGIIAKPGYFSIWVGDIFGAKRYPTIETAKRAIFDAIYKHGF